jgi:hypothetical protein
MGRLLVLMVGLALGLALAGIGAGLLIPQLPAGHRSSWIVALSAGVLIAACVGLAIFMTRQRRN